MANRVCCCLLQAARLPSTTYAPIASTSRRTLQTAATVLAAARPIPAPKDDLQTPADFLKRIGRGMEQHESKVGESWEDLWKRDTVGLKDAGITAPKERKYILRQMEYYRQDRSIKPIEPKPKKKFRGRGPRVQKGVRVR